MKTLYLVALSIMLCILMNLNYTNLNSESMVRQTRESLFDKAGDGNWEYMNSFKPRYSIDDIECLQKNIFFEAATESDRGKIAVGMVTINRVKSPKFPNTICGVVKQAKFDSKGNPIRHKCQFSWFCNGVSDNPNLSNSTVLKKWNDIGKLTRKILTDENTDIVGNSTFYHSVKVKPAWSKKLKMHSKIGAHVFYVESS